MSMVSYQRMIQLLPPLILLALLKPLPAIASTSYIQLGPAAPHISPLLGVGFATVAAISATIAIVMRKIFKERLFYNFVVWMHPLEFIKRILFVRTDLSEFCSCNYCSLTD